jgi:hypothetical protein
MRVSLAVKLGLLTCIALGCDKRSAEEKGKDYANDKLGFVEGAAQVLKDKGNNLGQTAGKGVSELVKGVGTGVKDVMNPPVSIALSPEGSLAGLSVHRANEAETEGDSRVIEAYVAFAKLFRGKLLVRAFDEKGTELGAGSLEAELDKHPGNSDLLRFRFPASVRFSHAKIYRMDIVPPVGVALHESLKDIAASQLKRKGPAVSLYLKFAQKYQGMLELRVYDDQGSEIGRSKPSTAFKQKPDSATFVEFAFDERAPLEQAFRYELVSAI